VWTARENIVIHISVAKICERVELPIHIAHFPANYPVEHQGMRRKAIIAIMCRDDVLDQLAKSGINDSNEVRSIEAVHEIRRCGI